MSKYAAIYRDHTGRLKFPLATLGTFVKICGFAIQRSEARAILNATQFPISLGIMTGRLQQYLQTFRQDSWVDVPIYELFLDTQSLFLFLQQFLEDLALILRWSCPPGKRHQLPVPFHKLCARLRTDVPVDDPLVRFLVEERAELDRMKDIRDDICHRTGFGRSRSAQFPDLVEVLRAAGGVAEFTSGHDLQSYITTVLSRILALACVVDEFVRRQVAQLHPKDPRISLLLAPSFIVGADEIDLQTDDARPKFPLGTTLLRIRQSALSSINYFLED